MSKPVNVLMVEDSENDAHLLQRELQRRGLEPIVMRVETGPALMAALMARSWDVVISDHNMPTFSGDEALKLVKLYAPDVPFIVVSGTRGEEQAVEAMRAGAADFIVKNRLHRLAPVVERELQEAAQRIEQRRMTSALAESQQQLRQAQKLEAVGRLAGGVAHDFNNLMAAILSYADLVLRSLPEGDERRADIEEIKMSGSRAATLTQQLLAFSRQQVLDRSVLDLNQVIGDVLPLLRRLVGEPVVIDVQSHGALWPIKGDRMQLEQILMNLAVNARDAMPKGGTLTMTTSNVVIASPNAPRVPATPGQYVRLHVLDTGEGIADDVLPKIFEPFFTTKDEGKGTGLGLATVYGIVQQSGGFIFVQSGAGSGASFTVYLPRTFEKIVAPPKTGPAQTQTKSTPTMTGGRVILLEADGAARDLSVRVLTDAGYEVTPVANADETAAALTDASTSTVLLVADTGVASVNGQELTARLRTSHTGLRLLLLTGFSDSGAGPLEIASHEDVLTKPFAPADLVNKVRDTLSRVIAQ